MLVGVGGQAGNVVRIQPPLVIADAALDHAIETIGQALVAVGGRAKVGAAAG